MEHPDEQLPLPPPFMWGCDACGALLRGLAATIADGSGFLAAEAAVARHIVENHRSAVPAPHTRRCDQCPRFGERSQGVPTGTWAEHLARSLFLPERVARLL